MKTGIDRKSRSSLKSILITSPIIFFFVAIIGVFYSMLYNETRQKITKMGELNAVSTAEEIDQYLSKGIETIKLACYTLDNMLRSGKSQAEIHDFLVMESEAIQNTTDENSTGLYGFINGEYIDGTDWVPPSYYSAVERPWYIAARANGQRIAVVDPYVDAQTGDIMITFSKTLCDAKSVAAMDFSIKHLQTLTEDIQSRRESNIEIVLNSKYQVIAHSDKNEFNKEYLEEKGTFGGELVKEMRTTKESNFSFKYNGAEYIVYRVNVSNNWICLSICDATVEFAQIRGFLIFTIVSLLVTVSILLLILIFLNKKREQVSNLSLDVVEALATAIDAKDTYTNGHSARVADYSREIARRFGYNGKKQNEIYMMGLLHDVGKIGIPDAVINKPGRLTEEEFELIKSHSSIGALILSKTRDMPRLAVGAHWHHERYDGTGYPDKLAGENIPEEARIIAVADSYDAMTSSRSYRGALTQEQVKNEIEHGKGTQFDPKFADIMLKMIEEDKDYKMHGQ